MARLLRLLIPPGDERDVELAYQLYGLRITSNCALPGLKLTAPMGESPDFSVRLGVRPPQDVDDVIANHAELFYESIYRTDSGAPILRSWKTGDGSLMRIEYDDGTQFWIDLKRGEIWAQWTKSSSLEDAADYLLGPVMGFVLRMRGVVCLHASSVVCEGRAAAFVGVPGAGKSTTAAAMSLRGHAVVSDDIVALNERDGRFYATPANPYVSLWPDAVGALYGAEKSLPVISRNYEKRRLWLDADGFSGESAPLDAIFILGERTAETTAPCVDEIAAREALILLVSNTYANLLPDEKMRVREFELLGRLVNAVPVRSIRAHQDPSRIGALCELIERELAATQSTPDQSKEAFLRSGAAGGS